MSIASLPPASTRYGSAPAFNKTSTAFARFNATAQPYQPGPPPQPYSPGPPPDFAGAVDRSYPPPRPNTLQPRSYSAMRGGGYMQGAAPADGRFAAEYNNQGGFYGQGPPPSSYGAPVGYPPPQQFAPPPMPPVPPQQMQPPPQNFY